MEKIVIKIDADLEELVPGFVENRKNDIPILKSCLENKDFVTIQSLGHRLKGNAGGYGFDYMGVLGDRMEVAAKIKDALEIAKILVELEDYINRLDIVFVTAAA